MDYKCPTIGGDKMDRFEYDEKYNTITDTQDLEFVYDEYKGKIYGNCMFANMDDFVDLVNRIHRDLIKANAKLRAAGLEEV